MKAIKSPKHLAIIAFFVACLVVKPAWAGLFGPEVELLSPEIINARLHSETLLFSASGEALKVHTKGAAVGGFLVGMVLSSALASSGGSGTMNAAQMNQQMQANMAIAQQANVGIQGVVRDSSATVAGLQTPELAQRGPLPLIMQNLNRAMIEQQVKLVVGTSGAAPALRLNLLQKEWKLDYSMMSSDYTLTSALTMELIDPKADKVHLRQSCSREYPKKMSLEAWELDKHHAVAVAAEDIAQQCYEEFSRKLDLPVLATAASAQVEVAVPETAESATIKDGAVVEMAIERNEIAEVTDQVPAQNKGQ